MTVKLLTIAWFLVTVTLWCCHSCEGAIIYRPSDQNTRWFVPSQQDTEVVDTNLLDFNNLYYKRNGASMQVGESSRSRPSLSIVNSLDVLRQKLMYEVARRHVDEKVLSQNHQILRNLGKRSLVTLFGIARRY
ncbi:uncharacterized protein LOC126904553 [Daktulosphaira vitifoliae]|uniref:uncharacterized protein LOC126904553 n=1 Tax=Daktulosphaira vitifoliae TaxID=58002 RepID=UPI0021AA5663|nr:uncharacterized protein LOC126904553 [Daktulosphaira vitifoliae]XP_050539628.1 uncharacterized protein LOC126904553 [Daktulosphaira vitifoliae]